MKWFGGNKQAANTTNASLNPNDTLQQFITNEFDTLGIGGADPEGTITTHRAMYLPNLQQQQWNNQQLLPGTHTTTGATFINPNQNQIITVPTPFGANRAQHLGNLISIMMVPTLSEIASDYRCQEGDIVLCMDEMKYYRHRGLQAEPVWKEVKIKPDMTVVEITPPIQVPADRKEIYDEFEKHLITNPEKQKDDRSLLKKAKDLLSPKTDDNPMAFA